MDFNELSNEQKDKARACKSASDLATLIEEEGLDLSDEQLESLTGGVNWPDCPTYQPGQNAPIPEALSNNPRVVHLIRSNVTL